MIKMHASWVLLMSPLTCSLSCGKWVNDPTFLTLTQRSFLPRKPSKERKKFLHGRWKFANPRRTYRWDMVYTATSIVLFVVFGQQVQNYIWADDRIKPKILTLTVSPLTRQTAVIPKRELSLSNNGNWSCCFSDLHTRLHHFFTTKSSVIPSGTPPCHQRRSSTVFFNLFISGNFSICTVFFNLFVCGNFGPTESSSGPGVVCHRRFLCWLRNQQLPRHSRTGRPPSLWSGLRHPPSHWKVLQWKNPGWLSW